MRSPRSLLIGQWSSTVLFTCLLSGCISLFPASEPAQLYRFGDSATAIESADPSAPTFNLFLGHMEFNRAAAGDRLLTMSGNQAAYIKGARWVTSAEDLFAETLRKTLRQNTGPARLVDSDSVADVDYLLGIQVETFEARYLDGADSAPDVEIAVHAVLTGADNHDVMAAQRFRASLVAGENRVGAIVAAYDQATARLLDDLIQWTNRQGPPGDR